MTAEGLGPEIAAAHVAVTASFRGMAASVQREAQAAGRTLGTNLTSAASNGARSAGQRAGQEFGAGFSSKASDAFKNVFLYGGAYAAIRGISSALHAAGADVIGFNAKIEQSEVAFKGLLGSSKAARHELAWVKDFAKTTPFQFGDLLTDDQQLIAMGASAKEAHEQITAIGDAAAGLGRGKESIDKMVLAIGQMTAKGRIQSDELLQLQEAGIPALKMLAKAYNATTVDMQKAITKGLISSDKAVPALIAQIEARFKGQMANQSKTFVGAISNIEDTLQQGIAKAGAGAFDEANKAAHEFLDYLNSPAGQRTIEDIGHAFEVAAKTADFLGRTLWAVHTPLLALGAGWVVLKAGEAILVRGASAAGSLAKAYQGAGAESSLAAKMNDAYSASLGRMAAEAGAAVGAIDRVAAAQATQAGRGAAASAITAKTSAFNSLPVYYGSQRGGVQASTYKEAQAAMDGAEASAKRLSISAGGVGRAFAGAAPAIGIGALAITSLTGAADSSTGKMVNFAATGAMLGATLGPMGVAVGAAGGVLAKFGLDVYSAQQALSALATSTSWDQLDARFEQSTSHTTSWWKEAVKIGQFAPLIGGAVGALNDLTGASKTVKDRLEDAGSSLSEAEQEARRGGQAWDEYRTRTVAAAGGSRDVARALDQLRAGAANAQEAQYALAESQFAATGASYKSAAAFIEAARQAGLSTGAINDLSAAARNVPSGSNIIFGTNALQVLQQIETLRQYIGGVGAGVHTKVGSSTNANIAESSHLNSELKQAKQKLQQALVPTAPTVSPTGGLSIPSAPKSGGGSHAKKAKKAKKAYSVDIYDPFADEGWEKLTGGQIAKDLAKMQGQADKAFAAMKKGAKTFSKEMKDLAHGKELEKAFHSMAADSKNAMKSMRGDIAGLKNDMKQMGKDLADAINPANFGLDISGATDFFGSPIKGSTEAALKAQLQQQGKNLLGEKADISTLSAWLKNGNASHDQQVGDYLNQVLLSGNKALMDDLVAGGKDQAIQIYNMTKSNNSIALLIGNQLAADTTAYAADRAEAAALQKQVNVLSSFVTQLQKDDKDGKLSKKELVKIEKYGEKVKKAFQEAVK